VADDLVAVAFARDVTEAGLIKGLLENAGIPSLPRPAPLDGGGPLGLGSFDRGFGGGPQQVLVHASRADEARRLLAETLVEDEDAD
jgi:Putative prokaryotic signal transducing protein